MRRLLGSIMTTLFQNTDVDSGRSSRIADRRPGQARTELCDIEIIMSPDGPLNGLGWSLSHVGSRRRDIETPERSELRRYVRTRTLLEDYFEDECLSDQTRDSKSARRIRSRYLDDNSGVSEEERYLFEIKAPLELIRDWFGYNMPKDISGLVYGPTNKRLCHSRPIPAQLRSSLSASLKTSSPARKHLVDAVAVQVLDYQLENMIVESQAVLSPREIGIVKEVFACLESCPENPPSVTDLAARFRIAEARLDAAFREFFGSTIHQAVQDIRFQSICNALLDGEPVKIIAYRFGYSSISNFTSAFRRHVGAPPREWLKQQE